MIMPAHYSVICFTKLFFAFGVSECFQMCIRDSSVAGCICQPDKEVDTLGIQIAANSKHKSVLLYDTEQSEVQLFKNVSNLLARAKQLTKPEELKAFCLTGMSRKEQMCIRDRSSI